MGKRKYDRMKHSGKKNKFSAQKDSSKGGKGWGDALTDHTQSWSPSEENRTFEDRGSTYNNTMGSNAVSDKEKPLSLWSIDDVKNWVQNFGERYSKIAGIFQSCGIDGATLMEITLEDMVVECGKGLATKKVWTEIKNLQMKSRAAENEKFVKNVTEVEPIIVKEQPAPAVLLYTLAPLDVYSPPSNRRWEKPKQKNKNMTKIYTIQPLTIVHVKKIGAGNAEITFPIEGIVSLISKTDKPVCTRLFMINGTPHTSISTFEFENIDIAKESAKNHKLFGNVNSNLYGVDGKMIGEYGAESEDVKVAVLEEIDDCCVVHLCRSTQVQTWSILPELVVQRSKKSIAWQLLKLHLEQTHKLQREEIAIIQKKFRSKTNMFIADIRDINDGKVCLEDGTINRKYWMQQAIDLKNKCEKQMQRNALFNVNRLAKENYLRLIGSTEANMGREPVVCSEEMIKEAVADLNLSTKKDQEYRLFRHFLRYANALTSALGNLLDTVFDEDVVDLIISFVDDGCADYVKNDKGSVCYSGTGSRCLDFFSTYQPSPSRQMSEIAEQLDDMWKEHPLTCTRLIFHLGAAREGKQDRYGFYCAMHWLYQKHPLTLLANIHLLPEINYYKAMLEVLERVLENDEVDRMRRNQWYAKHNKRVGQSASNKNITHEEESIVEKIMFGPQCYNMTKLDRTKRCLQQYDENIVFRAMHTKVAKLFATHLKEDLEKRRNLTLAAKWCPSSGGKHDVNLLMYEAICREVFPPTLPEYKNDTEFQYWNKVRNRLRLEVLTPLRKKLKVTETYVSAHKSHLLHYDKVPGSALRKHKKTFEKQDPEGWNTYLEKLTKGEAKANVGAIGPVELYLEMKRLRHSVDEHKVALLNAQWKTMVEDLRKKIPEEERDMVAAVDLSGSMSAGTNDPKISCFDVGIALSLIASELSTKGFKDRIVMFSDYARMAHIQGESFYDRYLSFESQRIGGGTTFDPIFQVLQQHAAQLGIPKRIIILSDMQIQGGTSTPIGRFVPIYLEEKCKFIEERDGLEIGSLHRPEIVFWNIQGRGTPARATDSGCSLVSGYSANMFKQVLCNAFKEMNREEISNKNDPLTVMLNAVNKPIFRKIRVVKSDEEALDLLRENLTISATSSSTKQKKKPVAAPVKDRNYSNVNASVQSALCCIPPEELWEQIQKIRETRDRAYRRWKPHINLFFPFIKDDGSDIEDFTNEVLVPLCGSISPFTIHLNKIDAFKRKKDAQLFVGPANTTEICSLWELLKEKLPEKVRERNRPDFHPHLSLGQFKKNEIEQVKEEVQANWTSIPWTIDRVYVITRDGDVPFETKKEIRLGEANLATMI